MSSKISAIKLTITLLALILISDLVASKRLVHSDNNKNVD